MLRLLLLAGIVVGLVVIAVRLVAPNLPSARTTPVYDPPVLAGQQLWGACAGGFHARRGDTVVVTSSGHCATEGTTAYEPDGTTVRGVFGPRAESPTCDRPGKRCSASDMNYLVIAEDRVPWGRLDQVDLGAGGYLTLGPGTRALRCEDVEVGDRVAVNGRGIHREGTVQEKGSNDFPEDGDYFPCMIATDIAAGVGDSGGAVLVDGQPAGVTSRSFGGLLAFTPLAEGLAELGLELCTAPDCGLTPP